MKPETNKNKLQSPLLKLLTAALTMSAVALPVSSASAQTDISLFIDGKKQTYTQESTVVNDYLLVPFRDVLEALGMKVTWDNATQTATATKNNDQIVIDLSKRRATLNGQAFGFPVAPQIIDGKLLVPVRFLNSVLGAGLEWDNSRRAVLLSTPSLDLFTAVRNNDAAAISNLLKQSINLSAKKGGDTPLQYALKNAQVSAVKLLAASGQGLNEADANGSTPLFTAVRVGNPELVQVLLDAHADANEVDAEGTTPLFYASGSGNSELVTTLLKGGANPNASAFLKTPLDVAVKINDVDIVNALLEAGAKPDVNLDESLPSGLLDAVASDKLGLIRTLLSHGADVNIQDKDGWSPLMIAAEQGNTAVIKLLLDHQPKLDLTNKQGATALQIALKHGNQETAALLRAVGASAGTQTDLTSEAFTRPIQYLPPVAEDWTPLMKAVHAGDTEQVKSLIAGGADPGVTLESGEGPLVLAVATHQVEMLKALLASHPTLKPEYKQQLWSQAINSFHLDTIKVLLDNGFDANISTTGNEDFTALVNACLSNDLELAQLLLDRGANAQLTSQSNGDTLLMLASWYGKTAFAQKLLAANVDPNHANFNGDTALSYAINKGNIEMLQALLSTPTLKDDTKAHALLLAVERGSLRSVQALLQAKADINFKDKNGKNALQIAEEKGLQDILTALQQAHGQHQ